MKYQKVTKNYFISNSLYYISLVLALLLILSIFCTIDKKSINWFFSSDALYLPSIYKDLFQDGGTVAGWHFNPSPNFFPDMPIYFLLMFLTGNFLLSTAFFAVVQYIIIISLFRLILLQILDKEVVNKLVTFSNFLLALYFVSALSHNDLYISFYLLINSYHTSAFTLSLLSFLLWIIYLRTGGFIYLILLVINAFLGVLSDQLMFITVVFPILLTSIFYKKYKYQKRIILRSFLFTLVGAVLGIFLFFLLRNNTLIHFGTPYKMFAFTDILNSTKLFLKDTRSVIFQLNIQSIILLTSIISLIIGVIISINAILRKRKFDKLSIYILFSSIFTVAVIISPLINGNYSGIDCYRYNIYPFYLGALNFPLYFVKYSYWFNRISNIAITVLLCFFIILIVKFFSISNFREFADFYPDRVKRIDKIASESGLLKGVGDYWDAKYITMFSKQKIRIYSVHPGLEKYYHVNNENWFNADTAIFNFVIDQGINHHAIKEKFKLDSISYIYRSPDIIKLPEFRYMKNSFEPILLE